MSEFETPSVPEPPDTVDALQLPAFKWTWNANTMIYVGLGILAVVSMVYFLMSFNKAKSDHGHDHGDAAV